MRERGTWLLRIGLEFPVGRDRLPQGEQRRRLELVLERDLAKLVRRMPAQLHRERVARAMAARVLAARVPQRVRGAPEVVWSLAPSLCRDGFIRLRARGEVVVGEITDRGGVAEFVVGAALLEQVRDALVVPARFQRGAHPRVSGITCAANNWAR